MRRFATLPSDVMRSLRFLWSALWRLQVSHLVVFVLVPALAAGARLTLGLVLMPLLLTSFGDRSIVGGTEVSHLRNPGCWVVLAPCSFGDLTLIALPDADAPDERAVEPDDAPEPFLPPPSAFTVRHAWLVLWLLWFAWFLVRREAKPADLEP